jgi:hypothetical protein
MSGATTLPFTTRSAWLEAQREDSDLRRVFAHLSQGTRPSRKDTNIKDVKRYLQHASIARDGLLVVKRLENQPALSEAIVLPRTAIPGLLTVLYLKLSHPSKHQLQQIVARYFYCLDLVEYVTQATENCHICQSLKNARGPVLQSTVGFAADVKRRERQFILAQRETVTSFTMKSIIGGERHDTLRTALVQLLCTLTPLDGPRCTARCDSAPGFRALQNDDTLHSLGIQIYMGRVKNINKNPVAEQAIREV